MKKELIIYATLIALTCALFAFEFMVKSNDKQLSITTYEIPEIKNISFEIPANVYFIKGNENKIILESNPSTISRIKFQNNQGQIELKRRNEHILLSNLRSMLLDDQLVNVYIISENIEDINFFNSRGFLTNNAIFNDDRGMLQVDHSDIIQFANMKSAANDIYQSCTYLNKKTTSLSSCL